MTIKKSMLFGALALCTLAQTPVSAPPKFAELKKTAADWFLNKSNAEENQPLNQKKPAFLAKNALFCALLAKLIEGDASIADYAKVSASSFAGATAASLLHTTAFTTVSKFVPEANNKTTISLQIATVITEFLVLTAGQNPEVVKSVIASIKAKTVGKDLTNFILSLGKDGVTRNRIAAVVRTFGPLATDEALEKLSSITDALYQNY